MVAQADEASVSFVDDVRPILSDKCFACHGPDEHTREADLRFDLREETTVEALLSETDEPSLVMERILSDDEHEKMPPPHINKPMSAEEIEVIRKWIAEGAIYEKHWSFRPVTRPEVPEIGDSQSLQPIDCFIQAKLAKQGLQPAERAGKTTLARRLYLDLLGVPPTPQEIEAFVNDSSEEAYLSLVNRLLDDKRFGERMAVYWLDLVRYADTIGYHSDTYMEVSAYRDYVIDAFNHNKPFDQFTTEQLAGDLLPEPTETQRVASGYNRLLQTTEEGGAQAKEYIAIYAADRVRNVSAVWMGMTVGCAQCHDHKYDPITMRDFYSLAAFFADIKERAVGKREPNLKMYTDQQLAEIASLKSDIESLRLPALLASNQELAQTVAKGQTQWESEALRDIESGSSVWQTPKPSKTEASDGVKLEAQPDGSLKSAGSNPNKGSYTVSLDVQGKVNAVRLETFSTPGFPGTGFSRGNGNFVLTDVKISAGDKALSIAKADANYEQAGWPIAHTLDKSSTTGWAIDGHHKKAEKRSAVFRLKTPHDFGSEGGTLTIKLDHTSVHKQHLIGRFRLGVTDRESANLDAATIPDSVVAALKTPAEKRTAQQAKTLRAHYEQFSPELQPYKDKLAAAEKRIAEIEGSARTTLVTETIAEPRMTRILPRGNWLDDSGDVVDPAVPEFLPHDAITDRRANRLDLAKWIMRSDNPLTSRTFVNRLWKLYFGEGLSRNLDDIGGQGQPPTHPQLLDWLSVEFQESGWDVKHMVRLLVTSDTYAQSSVGSAKSRSQDPGNRLYARQGRWRLEAEFVRDAALSIAGLLQDSSVGGKSVKPYQPAGYWQHLNFPKRSWQADQGDNLYRRSLYTFWCRTFLHPAMLAFDATSREECTAQRARSNIPQQALVLLNDPTFVEAARVFAAKIAAAEGDTEAKIRWAFRKAVSRDPSSEEVQLLAQLYQHQIERFHQSSERAGQLLKVGASESNANRSDPAEFAAWTQVARAIINLYETTSRF